MNTSSAAANDWPRKISPPSARGKKRHDRSSNQYHRGGYHHNQRQQQGFNANPHKRQKFQQEEPMDLDPIFPKLDQSDPVHANRIQQRRRAVAIGKNTPGYFEYCKKVPKSSRKPRSMVTPSTPDHTLDIPTKRWQGLVKAWRRSLHQYDPPDLVTNNIDQNNDAATAEPAIAQTQSNQKSSEGNIQSRQIEEAIAKGLLVDVTTSTPIGKQNRNGDDNDHLLESPVSVLSDDSQRHNTIMDFVEGDDDDFAGDDDSDDDLL